VRFADRTAGQWARETQTHPDTVRKLQRRFQHQGMLGLLPSDVEVSIRERATRMPDAVRQEIDRLKALYDGLHDRELARILLVKVEYSIDDQTVQTLWQQSAVSRHVPLDLGDDHTHPDRSQARLQVVTLYDQGWEKVSISRFLQGSRPTVDAWIRRFEAEHVAGLVGKRRGPQAPRKVWLPLMVQVYHLQKAHPEAGELRIWSRLAQPDIGVRTMLAGAMAPTEATWVALMVLDTACRRDGAPRCLVSDSGGAYTSADCDAVWTRLQIQPEPIVSTQGESDLNWMETHLHIQRRLYDDQFSFVRTPAELAQRHQAFSHTSKTTAHQGLLQERRIPPIPVEV